MFVFLKMSDQEGARSAEMDSTLSPAQDIELLGASEAVTMLEAHKAIVLAHASEEELRVLPGIGKVKAARIRQLCDSAQGVTLEEVARETKVDMTQWWNWFLANKVELFFDLEDSHQILVTPLTPNLDETREL
jgi:hypothetical protein